MNVNTPCPYDKTHKNTGKIVNKSNRLLAVCPVCNRSARVVLYEHNDGKQTASLSKTGRRSKEPTHVFSVRLNKRQEEDCRIGKATLTPCGNSLHLQYKQ